VIREQAEAISVRARDEALGILRADPSPAGQARAALAAGAAIDREAGRARSLVSTPACGAGCSWCCHVHVDATGPEILAVAAHLEGALAGAAREAFRERLAAHVERADRLDDEARWAARIPCALLAEDGRCSVYPVRPLRCRAFHSASAEACRDALAGRAAGDPPTIPVLDRACNAVEDGYERALVAAGLPAAPMRLERGLLDALRAAGRPTP
jgi:Fe-S-cluster containining protein